MKKMVHTFTTGKFSQYLFNLKGKIMLPTKGYAAQSATTPLRSLPY